jgi:predicted nucleic acid-binding protein
MTTTAKKNRKLTTRQQRRFVAMLPAIQRYAGRRFRDKLCEERHDLIAEVVAITFAMFVRLVERGKTNRAYASTLANYACRQVAIGRRLGTPLNTNDITSEYCCRRKGVRVQSLHRCDRKTGVWREILVEDHRATPADLAAARIDVPEFLDTLSARNRNVAEQLAAGESTTCVARMFRLSLGRISQLRRELSDAWERFHGEQLQPSEAPA